MQATFKPVTKAITVALTRAIKSNNDNQIRQLYKWEQLRNQRQQQHQTTTIMAPRAAATTLRLGEKAQ